MKLNEHDKRWFIGVVWQFVVYAIIFMTCCFVSAWFGSCESDNYTDKTYRTEIAGHYNILETGEKLSIERNGTWWIDESVVYPDEGLIYGTYTVNENDTTIIYFSYYIESEDEDVIDTMTVIGYDGDRKRVENAPTHKGKILTFEYTE